MGKPLRRVPSYKVHCDKNFPTRLQRPVRSSGLAEVLPTTFITAFPAIVGSTIALADRTYVSNFSSNNISVINTATNGVVATVVVVATPDGFDQFIVTAAPASGLTVPTLSEWALILTACFQANQFGQ